MILYIWFKNIWIFCKEGMQPPDLCLVFKTSNITMTCKVDEEEKTTTNINYHNRDLKKTRTKSHKENFWSFGKTVTDRVATGGFQVKQREITIPTFVFPSTVLLAPHSSTVEECEDGHQKHDENCNKNATQRGGSNVGSKLVHGLILSRNRVKSPVTSNFCGSFLLKYLALSQSSGFVVDGWVYLCIPWGWKPLSIKNANLGMKQLTSPFFDCDQTFQTQKDSSSSLIFCNFFGVPSGVSF